MLMVYAIGSMIRVNTELSGITLRSITRADLRSLAEHANDYEIWKFMRDEFPHPYTIGDATDRFDREWQDQPESHLAICLDAHPIGHIFFDRQSDILKHSASMGYWIARSYWGRGIATASIRAITDHVFCNTEIIRVFSRVFATNKGSIRALEKAGYIIEGYFPSAIVKEGAVLDQVQYARTNRHFGSNERQGDSRTQHVQREPESQRTQVRTDRKIAPDELSDLMLSAGWIGLSRRSAELSVFIGNSEVVTTLWADKKLVGLVNALSDGGHAAYIHFVVVHPAYRNRGFGRLLVETTINMLTESRHLVLVSGHESIGFFERCGFRPAVGALAMEIRRRRP